MMMMMMMMHSEEIRELETRRDTLADGRASSSFSSCMKFVSPPSLHPSLPGPRLSEWREGVHYARWDTERQRGEGQQLQVVPYFWQRWQTWEKALFWHTRLGMKGGPLCFEELPVFPNALKDPSLVFDCHTHTHTRTQTRSPVDVHTSTPPVHTDCGI